MPYEGVRPYLPSDHSKVVHIISFSREFWTTVTRKSASAGCTLCCPSCRVGENCRVAEAGDVGSAAFVNQDVCLRHTVMVNNVTGVWNGEKAYDLEAAVSNVHSVHVS
jgi:hypothetical protein